MRFIIRNNHDEDGITEQIASLLKERFSAEYGAVIDFGDAERPHLDWLDYYDNAGCGDVIFKELLDDNNRLSIPRSVLEGMLPYKSMALHIIMRETHYDIYEYRYCEDMYYKFLRYWYDFLRKHSIDFILFMVGPHHLGEYILYALAQAMEIYTVCLSATINPGLAVIGTTIENCGHTISDDYIAHSTYENTDYVMSQWFTDFGNRAIEQSKTYTAEHINFLQKKTRRLLCTVIDPRFDIRKVMGLILFPLTKGYRIDRKFYWDYQKRMVHLIFRARKAERGMDHIKDYNRLSISPDLSIQYIYFALQQTPEETLMPRAGEYKEQMLSLVTLSRAVDGLGIKIYVKEHFVQPHREKGFYQQIANLPNVELIDIMANSGDLIRHSIAVSTSTGTCILEAALNGKPGIYFGEGIAFKGVPGATLISDEEQARNLIKKIMSGEYTVSKEEGWRYLESVDRQLLRLYVNNLGEIFDDYDRDISAQRIVNYIMETITTND